MARSPFERHLAGWLAAATIAWPLMLAAATALRARGEWPPVSAVVYAAAGLVCHQQPIRSFHWRGAPWAVCARCAGVYLAAPLGAAAALGGLGRGGRRRGVLAALAVAAAPTAVTFVFEYAGLVPVSPLVRCLAALPLGAAGAWVIVGTARGVVPGIE